MRHVYIFSICVLLILSCAKDRNPLNASGAGEFAIYLLADDQITAGDASEVTLNSLILDREPLISTDDIVHYKWSEHSFVIKADAVNRVQCIADSHGTVSGFPFVVVVEPERIYLGAFWWAYSSLVPSFPHIELLPFGIDESSMNLKIDPSWIESDVDPRGDMRIYLALKRACVLNP